MNTRNAPLSPVSVGGNEWSSIPKYQNPANGDPYNQNNRGLISPPDSGGPNGNMNGFSAGPRSVGGPSPPPSVARSSTGTNGVSMYARRDSSRSMRDEANEGVLGIHYVALKRYLQQTSKDGRANPPPNRARDKLLRLSAVQFLELSTDVYDELLRRQSLNRRAGPPPPDFLQPEDTFHPKRNQARQKLSTLGPPRFRDLATDVFCELERRFPGFALGEIPRMSSSAVSSRGPPSRTGTPVDSMNGMPPRGPSRMRRPSDASSTRSGAPRMNNDYPAPSSPRMPSSGFDRPQQKQMQSNTIVPNKSTMVEEDDDVVGDNDEDTDAFGLERVTDRESKRSAGTVTSEADKRLLEDSQAHARDLQSKLDSLEDALKRKDDELTHVLDDERSRASADNMEKKQWTDLKSDLEAQLAEARNFNDTLRSELDRMREDHDAESRRLREQIDEAQQNNQQNSRSMSGAGEDSKLQQENQELRMALEEQRQVTEEVRREAQQFLQEMKMLSQQHTPSWDKQAELEKTVEQLEQEVRDWRNRYARAKTQLRSMRASSTGLTIDQDAGKYVRDRGFMEGNGLVKDVHVTKFQIAIDELLQRARTDDPEKVIDSMKAVVVSIRRITKDIDESAPNDDQTIQQRKVLKARVSATANNMITAAKNFASAAGISPVSLLDAAVSHLVAALVEFLRTVKIRATPAGELEDDDDGTVTPVESTGFFSNRSTQQESSFARNYAQDNPQPLMPQPLMPQPLVAPPRFQGLGGDRNSGQSSAYSPINSPRESLEQYNNGQGEMNFMSNKNLPSAPNPSNGYRMRNDRAEDLKIYLEGQTDYLRDAINGLVASIRGDAPIAEINDEINSIADVVGKVVSETEASGHGDDAVDRLSDCRQRLLEAGEHGQDLASRGLDTGDREWRMWTQTLPPIAFELARETKELVQKIDRIAMSGGADDFS
ncbi:uncharacterized protein BCR38DRAFT_481346 [Pseudomassariella vexata]|uniref:GIT Spa2 homology (SHD) domain-containing protein n=1 Tax=Pseudomassariella vexata TaxID=1141098 RepID=A0A1Y2EF58_9PEZI|nr:uncharacterized protein BCR38DRAFT_481346 [Pseudomassariella vexata]ORY70200.1 hypothetical protein BCR38DRAFT_481346 [Pseudomassariella vexata]